MIYIVSLALLFGACNGGVVAGDAASVGVDMAPACTLSPGFPADGGNPSCGPSSPPSSSCAWSCFYSGAHGYEWQSECCSDCGPLTGVAEPCAWRCIYDQRLNGLGFHWEELYRGCSR